MAETKIEISGAISPSIIAMTAKKAPEETDIYSAEMIKELEKRNKAVKTALSGIRKNIEKAVFNLYWIYQTGMYKTMGFDSITDYAAAEFDISKSTTYDFISVAEHFGKRDKDGKIQEAIDDKYKDYSSSKLIEMKKLDAEEIEASGITPEMSVRDIKKAVKRTLGSAGTQSKDKHEPSDSDITAFYECEGYVYDNDRNQLAELLKEGLGKCYHSYGVGDLEFRCTPRGISINHSDEITWKQYVKRLNELLPVQPVSVQPEPEPEDVKQPEKEKFTLIIDEVLDGKVLKSVRWSCINEKYILDMLKFHKDYQLVFHSLQEGGN